MLVFVRPSASKPFLNPSPPVPRALTQAVSEFPLVRPDMLLKEEGVDDTTALTFVSSGGRCTKLLVGEQDVRSQSARAQSKKHVFVLTAVRNWSVLFCSIIPWVSVRLVGVSWFWCDRGSLPSKG